MALICKEKRNSKSGTANPISSWHCQMDNAINNQKLLLAVLKLLKEIIKVLGKR
jgi:hypothetical protein